MTTVFKNGHVRTMNPEMPAVSAVVVEDDKIAYVGTDEGAKAFEAGAKVVDLDGKMLIPGLIDAHCHPSLYAFLTSGVMLDAEMTKDEVMAEIQRFVRENPDNENYFGIGYPEWHYDVKGPNKRALDAICADKPMFLMSNGGHEGWCNSKTFEVLHIDKNTPDPVPGYSFFDRDENGEPTGHLVETVVEQVIMNGLEWFDTQRVTQLYHDMFDKYSALGLTGFVDCGVFDSFEEKAVEYMAGFDARGELKQRICSCVMVEEPERLKTAVDILKERNAKYHSDMFNVNTLKIVNDGTMEVESAAMYEPYLDGTVSEPMAVGEELYKPCLDAARAGFDIHIHAIGNKAVHETLMVGRAVREAGCYDTRIINAHSQMVTPNDIPLFGKYNVLANSGSIWFYYTPDAFKAIGELANHQFEMGSIIRHGGRVTLGSDMPFDEMGSEPLKGVQMAVTRRLPNMPEAPIMGFEKEKMTVVEALEAYTINAAYGMHWEKKTGSIEVGKYADLVVLEQDLCACAPEAIMDTPVLLTLLGGKPTYVGEAFRKEF